jgi:VWFA-related protein
MMSRLNGSATWASVALLIVASAAPLLQASQDQGGQDDRQRVFRTDVDLVEVDVVVRGRDGKPVHGLRPEDFTLLDRGRPVSVTAFQEIARASEDLGEPSSFPPTLRHDVVTNTAPAASRLVALVLDDLHTYRNRTDTVKDIARDVVAKLGPHSSMALLFTSGDDGVEVTSDQSQLLAAIDRFKARKPVPKPYVGCDPRAVFVEPGTVAPMGCDLQETNANLDSYRTLESAARLLMTGTQRRKAFVLVSEGVAKDLHGLFDVGRTISPLIGSADNYVTDLNVQPPTPVHDNALLDMMEAMRRANIATYAIDPRGHVSSDEMLRECFPATLDCLGDGPGQLPAWHGWIYQAQDGLNLVSEASGGFGIVNTDDFTGGIDRILTDLDNYYLLGFAPEDRTTPGYRRLEVKVNRPDLAVRYRRGYDMRPVDEATPSRSRDPLVNLLSSALPTDNVPLRLAATVLPRSASRARVALTIEISEPRAQMEEGGLLRDSVRYTVAAVDLEGAKIAERFGQEIVFALRARPGAPADRVTYQLLKEIELPPGRYQLRAALTSDKMDAGGSVHLPIEVPDYRKEPLVVSPFTLGYADGSRVPQAPEGRYSAIETRARAPASQILPFTPTLDRQFVQADVLWLYFELWRAEPRRDVAVRLAAVDAADRIAASFDQTVAASDDSKVGMKLPLANLAPGPYRLRVLASDGERLVQREIGIVVK